MKFEKKMFAVCVVVLALLLVIVPVQFFSKANEAPEGESGTSSEASEHSTPDESDVFSEPSEPDDSSESDFSSEEYIGDKSSAPEDKFSFTVQHVCEKTGKILEDEGSMKVSNSMSIRYLPQTYEGYTFNGKVFNGDAIINADHVWISSDKKGKTIVFYYDELVAESTPTPTPESSPEIAPAETPFPLPLPTPEITAEPTANPTQEPTATPNNTSAPTPETTLKPTSTPAVSPTPTPTPTKKPTPTPTRKPTPTPQPTPRKEEVTYELMRVENKIGDPAKKYTIADRPSPALTLRGIEVPKLSEMTYTVYIESNGKAIFEKKISGDSFSLKKGDVPEDAANLEVFFIFESLPGYFELKEPIRLTFAHLPGEKAQNSYSASWRY
jgi:hypothetical protein